MPALEAVELYRSLAHANPQAYAPDLAMSLNSLAIRLSESGDRVAALAAARELAARNTPIALFLVDQRMPGMTGTELLREVASLHPASRRVLLTAYADTDVAIAGINEIGLDHYLMKPWDPPEQRILRRLSLGMTF